MVRSSPTGHGSVLIGGTLSIMLTLFFPLEQEAIPQVSLQLEQQAYCLCWNNSASNHASPTGHFGEGQGKTSSG